MVMAGNFHFNCARCMNNFSCGDNIPTYCTQCEKELEKLDRLNEINKTRISREEAISRLIQRERDRLEVLSKEDLIQVLLKQKKHEIEDLDETGLSNRSGNVLGVFVKVKTD